MVIILGTIINGSSGTILSGEGQFYLPPPNHDMFTYRRTLGMSYETLTTHTHL